MTLSTAERIPGASVADERRHGHDWLRYVPLLAALCLFAPMRQDFGFDQPGELDSFIYVGYFWHYTEHLAIFDVYYKLSRLPWVLPGFLAHTAFGPIVGSYVLHLTTLSAGGVALYLLLRDTLRDRPTAVIGGVAWVSLTAGHGIGGWNYHMLACSAYYLLACWTMTLAGRGRRPGWHAFSTGLLFACAVHTNLLYVLFTPLLPGFYLVPALGRTDGLAWRRVATDLAAMLSGALAITGVLMAINRVSGGDWLFFMLQVQYTRWISSVRDPAWKPLVAWLGTAAYLALPLLFLAAALVAWRRLPAGEPRRFAGVIVLQSAATLVMYAFSQFVLQHAVLFPSYMAFGLYCTGVPVLGVLLYAARTHGRAAWQTTLSVTIIVGTLLVGAPTWLAASLHPIAALSGHGATTLIAALILGGVALAVCGLTPTRMRLLGLIVWFALMNAWLAPRPDVYPSGKPGINRSMLALFRQTDLYTSGLDPTLHGIRYWLDDASEAMPSPRATADKNDVAGVLNSYVATRGWLGNLLGAKPGLPLDRIESSDLMDATCVGVLSAVQKHDGIRAAFRQAIAEAEIAPLTEIGRRRFESAEVSYELSVYRVASTSPRPGVPPCAPGS
jgi:hypothetical protein